MESKAKRGDRVGERLRSEIMELLMRGAVRDPAVRDAVVTSVRISVDLRSARIYVRLLDPDATETQRKALVAGLERASSFIRRELAPKLALKYQPTLKFFWDEGFDQAARVDELLQDISRESEEGS